MADRIEEILLLTEKQIRPLASRSMQAGFFGKTLEEGLQHLLQNFPQLIPGNQINPADPPKFVLLRREMPLGSWSLDHLFVDDKGILTLVETKLLQNPESRREVIGQIIEYGAYAAERWEIASLRQYASEYWQGLGSELEAVLRTHLGDDLDIEGFWQTVAQNLQQGRLRLIIAADELRPEVRRMIEFLNREMRNVEVLGLEWKFYGEEPQALVVVPRLIGQTQSSIDKRVSGSASAGKAVLWTVDLLSQAVAEIENARRRENVKKILEWAVENDCFVESRATYPTFGLRGPKGQITSISVQYDAIYLYMKENKYAGGADEIDKLVNELKSVGLIDKNLDHTQVVDGRNLKKKISELSESDMQNLLGIFKKYCCPGV